MTVTIAKLYDTHDQAGAAVRDLEAGNIPTKDISIIGREPSGKLKEDKDHSGAATGAATGAVVGGGAGLLAGIGMLAIPGLGPVVAAGWLTALATGAVAGAGAGGIIGALTDHGVDKDLANVYAEGIRRGGTLVAVRVPDDREQDAERILARHKFVDPVARGSVYRESGWRQFDPAAEPYAPPSTRPDDRPRAPSV
jgi:uncharacterized membrane protein